jgi:hypothetical protein
MSRREMVVLGSRIFALLLASWVFVELTYLPERVATYRHHLTLRSVMATSDFRWVVLSSFNWDERVANCGFVLGRDFLLARWVTS